MLVYSLIEPYAFLFYSWGSHISWSNSPCPCYSYVSKLLILLYLATRDVPSGSLTRLGTARQPSTIFSLKFVFSYPYNQFLFNKGFATSPRKGAVAEAIIPKVIAPTICFLRYSLLLPPGIPNTFSYRMFPLILINHHQFDCWRIFCVLG